MSRAFMRAMFVNKYIPFLRSRSLSFIIPKVRLCLYPGLQQPGALNTLLAVLNALMATLNTVMAALNMLMAALNRLFFVFLA